jgi:hypothetical protein
MSDVSAVIPAQLVLQVEVVPFAQMQQKQQAQQAIGNMNRTNANEDASDPCREFGKLMPEWMLDLGACYQNQEKFNAGSGKMGQFLQAAVKMASLEAAFAEAVQKLQSFGALKSWLNGASASSNYTEEDGVGTFASMIHNEIDQFGTEGNSQQTQNEQQGECTIVGQEAAAFENQAQSMQTQAQALQSQGNDFLGDEGTVGDFLAQIAEGFTQA